MELWEYLILLPIGLLAGLSGGLLGIGGSLVMIPAMAFLYGGSRQHLYQAAAMIVNFFVVAPAVIRHRQAKATISRITRCMIPSACIGAVAGVELSELAVFRGIGQGYLQMVFAGFLAYVCTLNVAKLRPSSAGKEAAEPRMREVSNVLVFVLVGLPTGLVGGLLGIGGGLVAVPLQQTLLRMPLPNAIANSATTILWSSLLGAAWKNAALSQHGATWQQAATMAACLIVPAMLGSWYAAG